MKIYQRRGSSLVLVCDCNAPSEPSDYSQFKTDFAQLKTDFAALKARVDNIETNYEYVVDKNLDMNNRPTAYILYKSGLLIQNQLAYLDATDDVGSSSFNGVTYTKIVNLAYPYKDQWSYAISATYDGDNGGPSIPLSVRPIDASSLMVVGQKASVWVKTVGWAE